MISVCPPRLTSGPQPAHDARPHPHRVFMQQRPEGAERAHPHAGEIHIPGQDPGQRGSTDDSGDSAAYLRSWRSNRLGWMH